MIISSDQRLRISWDDGLTWSTKDGAGIGFAHLWTLSFHPEAASTGGEGLFLAGGHEGVWGYDPVTGSVQQLNTGLPTDDTWVMDLDSPLAGSDGPAIAITEAGNVYTMDPTTLTWSASLSIGGSYMHRVAVVVQPHFDSTSVTNQNMFAAAEGLLWQSIDGGATWLGVAQFNARSTSPSDWSISALAMSEDYSTDRTLAVGRIRINTQSSLEFGEIWSNQAGGTFALRHALNSGVHSLLCTPPGPSGVRTWLAAARSFPNFRTFQDTGILLSVDGTATWNDHGNSQDFLLEDDPGMVTGNAEMGHEQELFLMPDYANEGEVWYVRVEGIFCSTDQGERWLQLEPINDRRCRGVNTTWGPNGEKYVFTAGYGMGGVRYDRSNDIVTPLPGRSPMVFGRDMVVSPNYAQDGIALFTGNFDLWGWQDPNTPVTTPTGKKRWHQPPVLNQAGERNIDLPRYIAISPHFNGRHINGDRTFFWITWSRDIRRSEDGGATSKTLRHRTNGERVADMTSMAVAPSYDALGTRTDVFAAYRHGELFKLVNDLWTRIANLDQVVMKMEIPSDWSRPANPCIFILLRDAPYLVRAYDAPGGLIIDNQQRNLVNAAPNGFTLHPDFANHPIVWIATDNLGIMRLDMSAPANQWTQVGASVIPTGHDDVAVSVDFENDNLLYTATGFGLFEATDSPNSTWTNLTTTWLRDNTWDSISTFSPNHPANSLPSHAWPWPKILRSSLSSDQTMLGDEVLVSEYDGDCVHTLVYASNVELLTFKGAGMGSVTLSWVEPDSRVVLATTTASLAAPGQRRLAQVSLANPSSEPTTLLMETHLNSGEKVYFDGFRFMD
ncbi:MAG: hypothetical protein GY747_10975 [Planctomycetes bacterium]|nr:hypothetical protein [Planctomycetota bacterium]MCP4772152.1 hypothetical protein [Planctomycetota bacterium]MCP4861387.1 hypothetical protein [Planctomycetota bacterium]